MANVAERLSVFDDDVPTRPIFNLSSLVLGYSKRIEQLAERAQAKILLDGAEVEVAIDLAEIRSLARELVK